MKKKNPFIKIDPQTLKLLTENVRIHFKAQLIDRDFLIGTIIPQ